MYGGGEKFVLKTSNCTLGKCLCGIQEGIPARGVNVIAMTKVVREEIALQEGDFWRSKPPQIKISVPRCGEEQLLRENQLIKHDPEHHIPDEERDKGRGRGHVLDTLDALVIIGLEVIAELFHRAI